MREREYGLILLLQRGKREQARRRGETLASAITCRHEPTDACTNPPYTRPAGRTARTRSHAPRGCQLSRMQKSWCSGRWASIRQSGVGVNETAKNRARAWAPVNATRWGRQARPQHPFHGPLGHGHQYGRKRTRIERTKAHILTRRQHEDPTIRRPHA